MSEIPIPHASLERLRTAYGQFEQLGALIAEAMGLDPLRVTNVNLPLGVFVVNDGEVGAPPSPERNNGVPA